MKFSEQRKSLLSSTARIQVPWIKVTIGTYTFGIIQKPSKNELGQKDSNGFSKSYFNIQYPNYVQSLTVIKINGQVNQYTLNIKYPITQFDDPNFFEKVFSSVSGTREIIFSYGDMARPTYLYKEEKAVITNITQSFDLEGSIISYTISAVSGAALKTAGCMNFISDGKKHKPSDEIKRLFKNKSSGLSDVFTGMPTTDEGLAEFIDGTDQAVVLETKLNVSALDYINYLVGCMIPVGAQKSNISKDIYILTLHDDTTYDNLYSENGNPYGGPYFNVTRTSYISEHSDAYELDIGYNTAVLVTNFSIENNENYSLYYDYQKQINSREYVTRINEFGQWEEVYAPTTTSNNMYFETRAEDTTWWTKITQYPINASVTVQGLLRPATLMTYLRLNVIFPGGHKHISSGLYIITKQTDQIDENGYRTTLNLTKIKGEDGYNAPTNPAASHDEDMSRKFYERTRFYKGDIYK